MPVGDRQKLITDIIGVVLNEKPQRDKIFEWFINKHEKEHFKDNFHIVDDIFKALNGDRIANINKGKRFLNCDAYFGGDYNFIFEFDEYQHFSSARYKALEMYPLDLKFNFSIEQWKKCCIDNKIDADKYRKSKFTVDFNFEGGRTAQRAYLDCFRDLLPQFNNLNPTLRLNEFEVYNINSDNLEAQRQIEKILKSKLNI